MSTIDAVSIKRVRRKKLIREAEGYLDLIMVFDDKWGLDDPLREQIADRVIECLGRIKNPLGHKPHILFLKGQACIACKRHEDAIHHLQQAAQLDNENIHVHIALAWCYKRTDRLDLSIESMKSAICVDKSSAIAHYNLACYLALAKDAPSAIMHLTIALDLNGKFRAMVARESDFDQIRDDPRFQAATSLIV